MRSNSSTSVVVAVVVSTFFVGFGGGVVFPILPNLGSVIGISPFLVGLILSANRLTRIFANAPAGSLVDRIGTRKPLIAGLFVEAVATAAYVVALDAARPAAWFLVARILWGIGSGVVFATAYTIAADVSDGDSRGTSMGLVRGGITLGFPAGLVLGGVVSDVYSVTTAFVLAAGFALLASVVAYALVPETHVSEHRTSVRPWELDTATPTLLVGFVNFGLYFAYLGAFFSTLVLFIDARNVGIWGYGPQGMSGLLMALTVVAASAFTLAGGKASDLQASRTPTLVAFLGVSFAGFALLAVAETLPTVALGSVLVGTGQGGTMGPLMALLTDLTPSDRMGRAMGTNNVFGDLGGGLGPMVTLPLLDTLGFEIIFLGCAVVPLLAGGVLVSGLYARTGSLDPETGCLADD
ncbi:MFS transporter [Haloarculaceae archaeon H-GB2-1]|nr:MFS transporter [Haloarculaceae archaeon H-GB1-1]MEA5386636.1 MFS transporter [Haloarculaceae archaeon H-GB11]MEA5408161.1 MFS transporter [Haloarculaceae archaeon H-GB2-1]